MVHQQLRDWEDMPYIKRLWISGYVDLFIVSDPVTQHSSIVQHSRPCARVSSMRNQTLDRIPVI